MRFRHDGLNLFIGFLAVLACGAVIAFVPSTPVPVRMLAGAGAAAIVGVIFLVVRYALTRDSKRLAMFAALRGWTIAPTGDDFMRRFDVFPFGSGVGGRVVNAVHGEHRFHDCATFTYAVGKPVPQFYQVTLVELGKAMPEFQLLPEDLVAGVAKFAGGQDIKIGNDAFDARWRIISRDPEFVRDVFGPELRARLDDSELHGMPLAISDGAVLTWQAGAAGVRRLSRKLDVLISVAQAIPDHAWKDKRP